MLFRSVVPEQPVENIEAPQDLASIEVKPTNEGIDLSSTIVVESPHNGTNLQIQEVAQRPELTYIASQTLNPLKLILEKCKQAIAQKKQKKLEKILQFTKQKGKINNADVCRLLHVSQSSATNYFNELEKSGKLRQVGKVGHEAHYELIN